jgi:hypothetical protein
VKNKKWVMPDWMKPYREMFCNTGGNSVEDLINGNADPIVNLPLSTIQFGAKSQLGMILRLHEAGKLQ